MHVDCSTGHMLGWGQRITTRTGVESSSDDVVEVEKQCVFIFGSFTIFYRGSAFTPISSDPDCEATFDKNSCSWSMTNQKDPSKECPISGYMG